MNFTMPCETYVRLTNVLKSFHSNETREYLKAIYLEIKNGKAFAVATNAQVMAIEFIGATSELDASAFLTANPALVDQCRTEAAFSGTLTIIVNDMLKYASAKTTLGYNYPGNAALYFIGDVKTREWRTVIPNPLPSKSSGAMALVGDRVANLISASPSGKVIFPAHIDALKPAIVRDFIDPNWLGIFSPWCSVDDNVVDYQPATVPEWCK